MFREVVYLFTRLDGWLISWQVS